MATFLDYNGLKHFLEKLDKKYALKDEIDPSVFEVADVLPTKDIKGKIYLIPLKKAADKNNYAEYIYRGALPISDDNPYDEKKWEKLGEVSAELGNYAKIDSTNTFTAVNEFNENTIFAGYTNFHKGLYVQERSEGNSNGGIESMGPTGVDCVWKTDGGTMDLSAYNDVVDEVFPFELKTLTSERGTLVEVGSDNSAPTLIWSYANEHHNIQEQIISAITGGMEIEAYIPVTDRSGRGEVLLDTSTHASTTYTLTCTNDKNKTVTKSITITANHKSHWGVLDAKAAPTNFTKLTGNALLSSKAATAGNITLANQYFCYVYPEYFGALTVIKDGNNFDVTSTFESGKTTIDKVSYYYYIMSVPAAGSGIKFTFA